MITNKTSFRLLVIVLLVSLTYLGVYFYKFHQLSSNVQDFLNFATYLSGLSSIASFVMLIILLLDNKKNEIIEDDLMSIVDKFEIYKTELVVFTNEDNIREFIDGTKQYSEQYIQNSEFVLHRLENIYTKVQKRKYNNKLLDHIKNSLLSKIGMDLLIKFKEIYPNNECIKWLSARI